MADHFGRQLRWIRHDDSHNPGPVPATRTIVRVLVLWVFDSECTVCRIEVCSSRTAPARGATLRKVTRRSGGIGRRAWFRSMYPQGCGGSSPFFGTMIFGILYLGVGDTYSDTTPLGESPPCPTANAISQSACALRKVCAFALSSRH